jgi:hypothetical protein
MRHIKSKFLSAVFAVFLISGCATTVQEHILDANESQLKLRSIQTRAFDTNDKEKIMRSIMATLQDLDFVITKADYDLGIVTATKFANNQVLKMTVIVREKDKNQLLVRVNAQYGIRAVNSPEPYQDFFDALSKSIFLTAQQID